MTLISPKIILCLLLLRVGLFNESARAATLAVTPSAISSTYTGMIALQLGGLTNGETVLIEKFLDANANSVIDADDFLIQSFRVTDNQVATIAGKTNVNVPGDSDVTGGAITTLLNFHRIDLEHLAGSYAFRLSSPSERFTPVTNIFNVTNAVYAQSFTGQVRSNGTTTAVANALVLLLEANDDGNFVGGVVADNSGNYTINAAPGEYLLAAFKNNFLGDFTVSPVILTAGVIVTNNVNVVPATRTISGRVADAANTNIPLPGVMMFFDSDEGLVTIGFTDATGNFNVPVTASGWEVELAETDAALHGYLQGQYGNYVDTVAGNVSDLNIFLPKGTALFYGSIEDDLGNPLPGYVVSGNDQNHQHESDGVSDANGDYAVAVLAGSWGAHLINDDPQITNYVFSGGDVGNVTLTNGQAVRRDFVLKSATHRITGFLKDNTDMPISGVQIYAYAYINGTNYQAARALTDGSGNYSLNVANGNWSVGVNCCNDCDDGLDAAYQCPQNQNVTISNGNGVANFTVQAPSVHLGGRVVNTSGDPVANIQMSVNNQMGGHFSGSTDINGYFNIGLSAGTWNLQLSGNDTALGLVGPSLIFSNLVDGANITDILFVAQNVTAHISGNVHETNLNPFPFVNVFASITVNGTNYYTRGETDGDGNYSIGVFNGTWSVGVDGRDFDGFNTPTNESAVVSGSNVTVDFTIVPLQPLQITTTTLPNAALGISYNQQIQASGGELPHSWYLPDGLISLPPGLNFSTTGLLSGTPNTSGIFIFTVGVSDSSRQATQSVSLTITEPTQPTLSSPGKISGGQFQLRLTGASNQNYTIQYSTTLTNWISFFTTNSPTDSFNIIDPDATNGARFYRALIGP